MPSCPAILSFCSTFHNSATGSFRQEPSLEKPIRLHSAQSRTPQARRECGKRPPHPTDARDLTLALCLQCPLWGPQRAVEPEGRRPQLRRFTRCLHTEGPFPSFRTPCLAPQPQSAEIFPQANYLFFFSFLFSCPHLCKVSFSLTHCFLVAMGKN